MKKTLLKRGDRGSKAEARVTSTALHEAGHVIVDVLLLNYRVSVTIVPAAGTLGVTDGPCISDMIDGGAPGMKKRMADFAVSLVAGKMAEEMFAGKPAGASADGDMPSSTA